jgi:hypothetical protein
MRSIEVITTKSKQRLFSVQCMMDIYEESNATIEARHPKMFKNDKYTFHPSNELVVCMFFELIDGFKVATRNLIDNRRLTKLFKHLKQAQSSSIKQIRFIRLIGRQDLDKT